MMKKERIYKENEGVLDYVRFNANKSTAISRYHKIAEHSPDLDVDGILAKLKEESFTDKGALKYARSHANNSAASVRYHKIAELYPDLDVDGILAKLEEEGFTDKGLLDFVRSNANKTKKADERAVNKYNMIPARSDQIISVFCPDSNCKNTGFTKYIYNHSDGKTKIVRPLCGKRPTGKRECQKTMDPVETPTPLETISERAVQKIENVCLLPLFVLPFTQNIHSHYIIITYPLKMILRKRLLLPMYHLSTR